MSVYKGQEKVLNSITAVEEAKVKEIAKEVMKEKKWYIVSISLESTTASWQTNSITVPEVIGAEKARLFDGTNNVWTDTYDNFGDGVMRKYYTNGLGTTDGYMFTQNVGVNFKNGTIENITTRDLTNNPPKFTAIAYYK